IRGRTEITRPGAAGQARHRPNPAAAPGPGGPPTRGVASTPDAVRPGGVVPLPARLEAMRASGMSDTAIRRALSLSEAQAVVHGIIARPGGRVVRQAHHGEPILSVSKDAVPERPEAARRGRAPTPAARGPSMAEVLAAVARASGQSPARLRGAGQAKPLARARQLAMYLLRTACSPAPSLESIGHVLARDHSTVLYGCRKAESLLESDAGFRALHDRVRRGLGP
ncbi:MAG: helix-turn-helix domain-containing protein, partial [Kiloniellaceae bacterium]